MALLECDEQLSFPHEAAREVIGRALIEDAVHDDITTRWSVPETATGSALIVAKAAGVVAGIAAVCDVYAQIDPRIRVVAAKQDGQRVIPDQMVAEVSGPIRAIVSGERVALNLLQRLSGIATSAAAFADAIRDFPARIIDTRKTAPGMRALDKYAVSAGGAGNHRLNLSEMVLLKENHIAVAGGVKEALRLVNEGKRTEGLPVRVEVEVCTVEQAREAMWAGATWLMLDNMPLHDLTAIVHLRNDIELRDAVALEASGDVRLETVRDVAATGVDFISVGAITHSAAALDLSLLLAGVPNSKRALI